MSIREFLVAGGALAFGSCFLSDSAAAPASAKLKGAAAPVVAEESGEEGKGSADGKCGKSKYAGWLAGLGVEATFVGLDAKATDRCGILQNNLNGATIGRNHKTKPRGVVVLGYGDFSDDTYFGCKLALGVGGSQKREDTFAQWRTVNGANFQEVVTRTKSKVDPFTFSFLARVGHYFEQLGAMAYFGAGVQSLRTKVTVNCESVYNKGKVLNEVRNKSVSPVIEFAVEKIFSDRYGVCLEYGKFLSSGKSKMRSFDKGQGAVVGQSHAFGTKNKTQGHYFRALLTVHL